MTKLKFGNGNAKLAKNVATFSLPAGKTCPGASDCRASAVKKVGKLSVYDYPGISFRCFAASDEARYPATFEARKFNVQKVAHKLKVGVKQAADLISSSVPAKADAVRIHVSGDFFSQEYFDAWMLVAKLNPTKLFYAYTKSIPFWVKRLKGIPKNFVLTASIGGKYDTMALKYSLQTARVVYSDEEARKLGLEIDHDDSHAMVSNGNFALLIHGPQPIKSAASIALSLLPTKGYSIKRRGKALAVVNV